ncbi:MAG: M23 family metallopeptidase [Deltaproteobacteria bacterium]|uniref:M23 family metallopeptidase n=1 Tax=Candidatus Zymogenus saltonus TaxID=2844893 RepID=A0A9D8KD96_9DELT|nr:M23 family metallopeptidase [Candidatus Zymogenus saltonus]
MIVTDGAESLSRFKISSISLNIMIFLFIASFILSGVLAVSYVKMHMESKKLAYLEEETEVQERQIKEFESTFADLSTRLNGLKALNDKLCDMADVKVYSGGYEMFGIGGPLVDEEGESKTDKDDFGSFTDKISNDIDRLQKKSETQGKSLQELYSFLEGQQNRLDSTPSILPTRGIYNVKGFGFRKDPITGKLRMHNGVDIINKAGTPIFAPAVGVVSFTGIRTGYGKYVIIDHGYGISTGYGHLENILVDEGDRVKRGQKIALMGNTGRSIGTHLHYEVRINDVPINPLLFVLN